MKVIIGQGNPGKEYENTRHNIGFRVVDTFAEAHNATFSQNTKFKALIAEVSIDGEKVLLVKPQTFYNETGVTARAIMDFYKLDPSGDILVVHDELALPFGTLRTREKGSDAGNNGVKSLNSHLGQEFGRIRFGIWNDQREQMGDMNFVLGTFSTAERQTLPELIEKTHRIIDTFLRGEFVTTTH